MSDSGKYHKQWESIMNDKLSAVGIMFAVFLIGGCSTAPKQTSAKQDVIPQQKPDPSTVKQQQSQKLVKKLKEENERLSAENQKLSESVRVTQIVNKDEVLPPNAKPGECYAQVLIPPQYSTETRRMVKKPATYNVQITPPKYSWVEEQILIKDESETIKVQPARYEWQNIQVVVKEASEKIISVPAKYDTVTEKVLIKPAYSTWKKGKGPIQKVDHATGEIMCLVEIPAEYKTVEKQVLIEPATTKKVEIPAEHRIIKKRVLVEPEKVVRTVVPAQYRTIKVKKVVEPAVEKRVEIPAQYETIDKSTKIADSILEWQPILCETNTTPDVVKRIQQALDYEGYNPGGIDGRIGERTMAALTEYQKSNGLASGQITMETLKELGVSY